MTASELLHHYTTAAGLTGIVASNAIWATDVTFLNDAQEIAYARDEIFDRLRRTADELDPGPEENYETWTTEEHKAYSRVTIMRSAMQYLEPGPEHRFAPLGYHSIYASCFCERGDLLSQWRAYGGSGGFAIGFRSDALRAVSGPLRKESEESIVVGPQILDEPKLVKVVYGLDKAKELIEQAIQDVAPQPTGHPGNRGWLQGRRVLLPALASVKHPAFSEEQEWRLLIAGDVVNEATQFRTGPLGVTPYVELSFPKEAIGRVIIGPGPNVDVRTRGVKQLLIRHGLEDIPIALAEAPLRG